jgi:hypothetical protein
MSKSQFWPNSPWKSVARLENGCHDPQHLDRAWIIFKLIICRYCPMQVCKTLMRLSQEDSQL